MQITLFYITTPDESVAKMLGHSTVERKLAACANIFPMQSVFPWNNKLNEENEFVLILKTLPQHTNTLRLFIAEQHPYEVPCIISWEVEVNEAYGNWIIDNVKPSIT